MRFQAELGRALQGTANTPPHKRGRKFAWQVASRNGMASLGGARIGAADHGAEQFGYPPPGQVEHSKARSGTANTLGHKRPQQFARRGWAM